MSTLTKMTPPPPRRKDNALFATFLRYLKLIGFLFSKIVAQNEEATNKKTAYATCVPIQRRRLSNVFTTTSGKSMIEMLSVLAIVCILSVAALTGLTWATAKYRANDTIHDVSIWTLAALDNNQLYDMTSGQLILSELGSVSTHGYPMAVWVQDKKIFTIHVNDVPKRVCSLMLDMINENQAVTVNDVRYQNNDICAEGSNMLIFYMNKDMKDVENICIPPCEKGESCCGGKCRTIQTPCGVDGCTDCGSDYCTTTNTCCPTPTATKCGDTDCCDTKCCNGACCPESYMTCDTETTCGCPNNMISDPNTGACKCPDDAPYFFEEAGICCKSGHTPIDGVCQKVDCRGGPISYNCYINDELCGYQCDSVGRNCTTGICYADMCTWEETFNQIPIPADGGYVYGCFKPKNDRTTCFRVHENRNNYWYCYLNDKLQGYCCIANNTTLTCTTGVCEDICPDGWTYQVKEGRCTSGNLLCLYHLGTWKCLRNNVLCGSDCTDLNNCGTCQDIQSGCTGGLIWNDETQQCESDDMYCAAHATTGYQECYKKDGTHCGMYYTGNGPFQSASGNCVDPGCPEGMIYGQVNSAYWGCVDETAGNKGMACHYNGSYKPAECRYNQQICGRRCNYNGTNCGEVYLPQCALAGHCPQTGYDMSDGCTCDGDVTSADGTDYCCPAGHAYINGACSLL